MGFFSRVFGMTWDERMKLHREWLQLADNDVHTVEQALIQATRDAEGPPTFEAVKAILTDWKARAHAA